MKYLVASACLLVNAVCLTGQTKFQNAAYGYSGEVPAEWKVYAEIKDDPENHASIIDWGLPKVFSKLEKTNIENAISITAYNRPEIKNIDDLVKFEFERVGDIVESKKKSMEMSYLAYTVISNRNGHQYKGKTAFAYKNGIGYVFIFTATPGTFDVNLPKFQAFLQSIELSEPKRSSRPATAATAGKPHFDGLYLAKTSSVKIGDNTMDIYNYIRFYEDGTVYTQSVNANTPEKVCQWMGKSGRYERKGTYTMNGSNITFTVNNDGTEDKSIEGAKTDSFSGKLTDDNKLFLEIKFDGSDKKDAWFEFAKCP